MCAQLLREDLVIYSSDVVSTFSSLSSVSHVANSTSSPISLGCSIWSSLYEAHLRRIGSSLDICILYSDPPSLLPSSLQPSRHPPPPHTRPSSPERAYNHSRP